MVTLTTIYGTSTAMPGTTTSVKVSPAQVHHLVLSDSAGTVKALLLSIPGQKITVDPKACVEASLFLTVGVGIADPVTAQSRLQFIRTRQSYAALVQYATTQLQSMSFQLLAKDDEYVSLGLSCIEDLAAPGSKSQGIFQGQGVDYFSLSIEQSNPSSSHVTVKNAAWRKLEVNRLDFDASGTLLNSSSFLIGGATGVSYGDLREGLIGTPYIQLDPNKSDFTNIARSEYWIRGPGKTASIPPPSQFPADSIDALGSSIVEYLLLPAVSSVLDVLNLPEDPTKLAKEAADVWQLFSTAFDFKNLTQAEDAKAAAAAMLNLFIDMLTNEQFLKWLASEFGIKEAAMKAFTEFLLVIDLGWTAFNVGLIAYLWYGYTRLEFIPITSTGTGVVVIGP